MNTQDDRAESDPAEEPFGEPGCGDAVDLLYQYLDGELDGDTVMRIEVHLRRCSPCLEAFDFHDELRNVIRSKCAESMPPDMRARLLAMLSDPTL
ncbi:MAG: mycothiol system anti-sigma-R factor [Microthrixaceae bacterium]|nr:mycothiol system anti-sigma-R factor [Microthrixaceae bacterium]